MKTEMVRLPMTLKDLSHELRTPLVGILGMARQLNQESLTPDQKSYVQIINEAGINLLNLANRLSEARCVANDSNEN